MRMVSLLSFLVFSFVASAAQAALTVGEPAPLFGEFDAQGDEHKLTDYRGKIVVLEWKNHQCPFVKKHYKSGNMQRLQKQYTEKDVVWFTVVSSAPGKQGHVTPEEALEVVEEEDSYATAVLLDPEGSLGRLYDAKVTPHMYVIDKAGKLAYAGAIDSIPSGRTEDVDKAENYVVQALDALLAGKPVETPVTQPYGCSIKY